MRKGEREVNMTDKTRYGPSSVLFKILPKKPAGLFNLVSMRGSDFSRWVSTKAANRINLNKGFQSQTFSVRRRRKSRVSFSPRMTKMVKWFIFIVLSCSVIIFNLFVTILILLSSRWRILKKGSLGRYFSASCSLIPAATVKGGSEKFVEIIPARL